MKVLRFDVLSLIIFSFVTHAFAASSKETDLAALMEALRADEVAVSSAAADSLFKTGSAAIPFLEEALQDANFLVRQRSAKVLGRFGPKAKSAAPSLAELLKDTHPEIRMAAEHALLEIGPEIAVPVLSQALRREEESGRRTFIETLGKCGPAAAPILFSELKKEENAFLRVSAANALGQIRPTPDAVAPALALALGDLDEGVRGAVADALAQLGEKARSVLGPLLIAAHADKDPFVRQQATKAIQQIGKAGPESLPGLVRAVRESDPAVRLQALLLIDQSNIPDKEVLPIFEMASKDSAKEVRAAATQAMSHRQSSPASTR